MRFISFVHPQKPKLIFEWDLDEGLLHVSGNKIVSLDRSTQVGDLLFRFLEYKILTNYGAPEQTCQPKQALDDIQVRSVLPRLFETLDISKDDRALFVKNIRGHGYEWLVEMTTSDTKASSNIAANTEKSKIPLALPLSTGNRNAQILVRRSSRQAFDAGMILRELSLHHRQDDYLHLNQGLYVERNIEPDLLKILSRSEKSPHQLMIMGEAGFGKTSLLWRLYDLLSESRNWKPVFLEASWLSNLISGKSRSFDLDRLYDAFDYFTAQNKKNLVLIDTVDLLLHRQFDKDAFLDILFELTERGCHVIISSRPEEALELQGLFPGTFKLEAFDNREMSQAAFKHARRLHPDSSHSQLKHKLANLKEAVTRGRPVYDLCRNPLLLRMLFVLYIPENIPPEIHAFQLYQDYWAQRVISDQRAGQMVVDEAIDCSGTVSALALAMVQRGLPALSRADVEGALQHFGEERTEIDELRRRSILAGPDDSVRFFHQTFFEYCAAKAFLGYGPEGLDQLTARMNRQSTDFFLEPILDQAMLAAEGTGLDQRVRYHVSRSIKASEHTKNLSGIYLYTHLENNTPDNHAEMCALLETQEENTDNHSLMIHFLEYAPNVRNKRRWSELWKELEIIWKAAGWRVFKHFLRLLRRFAYRDSRAVLHFLQEEKLVIRLIEKPEERETAGNYLSILRALIPDHPNEILHMLMDYYQKATNGPIKSRKIETDILELIACMAPDFRITGLAQIVLSQIKDIPDNSERDKTIYNRSLGRLMAWEYREKELSFGEIFGQLPRPMKKSNIARLNALAFWLISLESTSEEFWSKIADVSDSDLHWYALSLFPILLNPKIYLEISSNGVMTPWVEDKKAPQNRMPTA